jgi:L-threonylcarbamoyladenylate synthase
MINENQAIALLKEGKVVAVPTETVYGLAADALNPEAIAKIFEIKNRPSDNPLICHFYGIEQIRKYVVTIPDATEKLIQHFSPGPISFMLDIPKDSLLKFATCGSNQMIARIPDHKIFLSIIQKLSTPVAAPSANTSGRVSPTSAIMVLNDLGEKVDGIVDGGTCNVGVESTIVDARNESEIKILRPGAIGEDEIKSILPSTKIISGNETQRETTPGTKYKHYAPHTPVMLISDIELLNEKSNAVLLLTAEQKSKIPDLVLKKFEARKIQLVELGSINNLNELAKNFYSNLAGIDLLEKECAYMLNINWGSSSLGKALENRIAKIFTQ